MQTELACSFFPFTHTYTLQTHDPPGEDECNKKGLRAMVPLVYLSQTTDSTIRLGKRWNIFGLLLKGFCCWRRQLLAQLPLLFWGFLCFCCCCYLHACLCSSPLPDTVSSPALIVLSCGWPPAVINKTSHLLDWFYFTYWGRPDLKVFMRPSKRHDLHGTLTPPPPWPGLVREQTAGAH